MYNTLTMSDDRPADDNAVIGEIAPAVDAPPPEQPPEATPRRRGRRSIGYTCLLAALGALVGALLAVLWGLGLLGNRETPNEAPAPVAPAEEAIGGEWVERIVFAPTPERPETTPDIIPAESPVIYCFYEHSRIPPDAALTAHWWHEGKDLGELELRDHKRGPQPVAARQAEPPQSEAAAPDDEAAPAPPPEPEEPLKPPDHAMGRFSIYPPPAEESATSGFPPGVYEVELSCVGREELAWRGSFMALPRAAKILEGGGPPDAPLLITDLQVAAEVDDDGKPVNPATQFPGSVTRIYACFQYKGMAPGGSLTVRWHVGNLELTRARDELAVSTSRGRGNAWLERSGPDPFPPGEYRVTVHLGEDPRPLASLGFTIIAPALPGASP